MFYGLQVVPGKKYEQEVEVPFRVTMATLAHDAKSNTRSTLYVTVDEGSAFPVATLVAGKLDQQMIDVEFSADENVAFHVEGPNAVHLIGSYMIDESVEDDDEEGSDMDPKQMEALRRALGQVDSDDENGVNEDEDEDEEEEEVPAPVIKRKNAESQEKPSKKQKQTNGHGKVQPEVQAAENGTKQLSKKQKQAQKLAENSKTVSPAPQQPSTKLAGGLVITDIHPGDQNSKSAKRGNKVQMRYIGKLTNGKIFDENTKGAPFSFKLGAGEVIKGWDLGIEGMKVGGRRKLVIPAPLAYGKRGAPPDIPSDATLEFEVKLLAIK